MSEFVSFLSIDTLEEKEEVPKEEKLTQIMSTNVYGNNRQKMILIWVDDQ